MRIIGLDLAITSQHKAVAMDESGKFLTPVFQVSTWPEALAGMLPCYNLSGFSQSMELQNTIIGI